MIVFGILVALFLIAYAGASLLNKHDLILATASGRSKAEILQCLGQPQSISSIAQGRTLLQWQRKGDHVAILFNKDVCERVTHKHSAKGLKA